MKTKNKDVLIENSKLSLPPSRVRSYNDMIMHKLKY